MPEQWINKVHYRKILVKIIYLWISLFLLSIGTFLALFIAYHSLQKERASFYKEAELFKLVSNYQTQFSTSTVQIRSFLITGQPLYFSNYLRASNKLKDLNNAIKYFQDLNATPAEINILVEAKRTADNIRIIETHVLKLLATAYQVNSELLTDEINSYVLTAEDNAKSPIDKLKMAQSMLFDEAYLRENAKVVSLLNDFQTTLEYRITHNAGKEVQTTDRALVILTALLILQAIGIAAIIWLRAVSFRKYLRRFKS